MRRRAIVAVLAVAVLAVAYLLVFRDSSVAPHLTSALPTSVIGSGDEAVGVSADGVVLVSQGPPEEADSLPALPLGAPPKGGRLAGPMLEQARVLGAAPAAFRSCVAGSSYGESGVDVELRSGIELRFGDASRAAEKWSSAATVLADPSITALDYVDLHSPTRPDYGGEGHALPPAEGSSGGGCGG